MSSTNLLDLPAEMLYEIVRHLGHGDQVSLASTCKHLRPLRPREQTVLHDLNNKRCGRCGWTIQEILR